MSTSSLRPNKYRSRGNSLQQEARHARDATRKRRIPKDEAYSYALRSAYLSYLLQPRQKRLQHVPAPQGPKVLHKGASTMDHLKEFSSFGRDNKSTKFPHAFMSVLQKRITGVLQGTEKLPEYNDNMVKRTFGAFLNDFLRPEKKRMLERERKMEELLAIFSANCIRELQKGKPPDDDSWKWMLDRYMALFVRLNSAILKDNDWARERPELASRLQTLEKKLLMHDQNLAAESTRNGGAGGQTIEVDVPLSHEPKDMPLALMVSKIFNVPYGQMQDDINRNRAGWTEKEALQDLKTYQQSLSLNTRNTLGPNDFDTADAYETWKKGELQDVSQMILNIVSSNPELRAATSAAIPQLKPQGFSPSDAYSELSRKLSEQPDGPSSPSGFGYESSIDFNALSLGNDTPREGEQTPFTFLPPDPGAYYRALLREVLLHDINDPELQAANAEAETPAMMTKKSIELLNENAMRWRVPAFSRRIMFLDVILEVYQRRDIDLETLETALLFAKEPPPEAKKSYRRSLNTTAQDLSLDWTKWTVNDYMIYRNVLTGIHDEILRDLFQEMTGAYDAKSPRFGMPLYILNEYIYSEDLFAQSEEAMKGFSKSLEEELERRAAEAYRGLLKKCIPPEVDKWEFYHVIQLGKEVVTLCEKIRKRYKKTKEIMGASPLMVLVSEVLPAYATDARELVDRITKLAQERQEEIPMMDGFELYRELVEIREVHSQILPNQPFSFNLEELLQEFVWRFIRQTEEKIPEWVENAFKEDQFHMGVHGVEDERHSVSIVDVFRSFNQSIQQIKDLQWDNAYQNAKFMTALSKAIGLGIQRYCDLSEQRFQKEMDRPSPEQEAAAKATKQEKWMNMAKNAWSNKDKVEPFQFLPESLVKLNNIEYAMKHLDQLEKVIKVDDCAEVIRKTENPTGMPLRAPRLDKYVFTIKIIEAEDLKPCDMNGLSDPYVVLGDEFQKRLAKTRIIYGNLNPRWDESVDIVTQGPLNIIATIWDWDTLGDHDCVGRTSLKLDPSHFRDFLPREYWLDLDTQGRLLLRVSMEGERDDIQFYFGKAFRALKRTERDMTRSVTDKLSAYIHNCLSRQRLKTLLSRGTTLSSVTSIFARTRAQSSASTPTAATITQAEVHSALEGLFSYFDANFAIMKETLTDSAMRMVMGRIWKETLMTIESLLVPPLSDKPSAQKPLNQQELDVVYKWLDLLFNFFNCVDESTGAELGVPRDVLKSPKYQDLIQFNYFYLQSTDDLIRVSERIAADNASRTSDAASRLSSRLSAAAAGSSHHLAPPSGHAFGGAAGLLGTPTRRTKTVLLSRNLGTMRRAKEEKRRAAQAEQSDDYILRILRMRPEAERYIRDRARQKEKMAAAVAAQAIVRQSLAGVR